MSIQLICKVLALADQAQSLSARQRQLPYSNPPRHRLLRLQLLQTWHSNVPETPAGWPS
jgi:hypothetical protein